jgi:RND family efflux transporter MFP subunit
MEHRRVRLVLSFLLLLVLGIAGYLLLRRDRTSGEGRTEERIAVVKVAAVERRPLDLERTFSGALEAESELVVAPKVGGRIDQLAVDLADPVQRGQIVAYLDDAEFAQTVIQAEAELAVTMANLAQSKNAVEISRREHQRIVTLRERGIASESESDIAEANLMEKEAQVKVAEAQVNRATAALESARIRYEYTRVAADWSEGDSARMVAERYVNEGDTVSANVPLLLIVQLDPIVAVIAVTERDYGRLRPGQAARITTDAFPGQEFQGRIERIAPVFRESSRQARIELTLANPEGRLKPGMFIRATITLDHVDDAIAVPETALTRRSEVDGVFLVGESGASVRWVPVELGIRSGGWVELKRPALSGRVVTLGQHLIDDGSPIRVVTDADSDAAAAP